MLLNISLSELRVFLDSPNTLLVNGLALSTDEKRLYVAAQLRLLSLPQLFPCWLMHGAQQIDNRLIFTNAIYFKFNCFKFNCDGVTDNTLLFYFTCVS